MASKKSRRRRSTKLICCCRDNSWTRLTRKRLGADWLSSCAAVASVMATVLRIFSYGNLDNVFEWLLKLRRHL
jgi:hypothetical protein